jgi:dynein heavy chain
LYDDLKVIYRMAGVEGHPVTFLFTDNEIKEEYFLEYINSILTSGEIASLFAKDEVDTIINDTRPLMRKLAPKIVDTADNLWKFFID